jgi:hypothetical protein
MSIRATKEVIRAMKERDSDLVRLANMQYLLTVAQKNYDEYINKISLSQKKSQNIIEKDNDINLTDMYYLLTVAQKNYDEQINKISLSQKNLEIKDDIRIALENKIALKNCNNKRCNINSESDDESDSETRCPMLKFEISLIQIGKNTNFRQLFKD